MSYDPARREICLVGVKIGNGSLLVGIRKNDRMIYISNLTFCHSFTQCCLKCRLLSNNWEVYYLSKTFPPSARGGSVFRLPLS